MEKHPLDHFDLDPASKCQSQKDEPLPNGDVRAPCPLENHHGESICDDCRSVDWSSVAESLKNRYLDLRPVNATVAELSASTCKICVILSTIMSPQSDGKRCVLVASPLSGSMKYNGYGLSCYDRASRCSVLSIVQEGKTKSSQSYYERGLAVIRIENSGSRHIASSSIDYSNLKNLIKICEKEHKECCTIESPSNVLGLEVIDTKTQEVVKAPNDCEYLALSYVWGKDEGSGFAHDIRKSPAVIRDAITVTNYMGYNYLWVDRYCISDSEEEKARMISQMDQIYAKASLTIIAAADGDTELGLCGVSMPRQQLRQVIIQEIALAELSSPVDDLTASKWATRGWTYQQGYLSRRRLIFTKNEVLFLCNGMYSSESMQRLLSTNCVFDDTSRFNHLIPPLTANQRGFSARDLLRQIEEYSKRELTRSSDSLNAILGVLNWHSRASTNLRSQVLQLPWGLIANRHWNSNTICFGLHILWSHDGTELPTRRREFPSWSWTGWGGPVSFRRQSIMLNSNCQFEMRHNSDSFWKKTVAISSDFVFELQRGPLSYIDCTLSMLDGGGNILMMHSLAWKEFQERGSTRRLYQPGPNQLRIDCLVIPMSFQEFHLTNHERKKKTLVLIPDAGDRISCNCKIPDGDSPILQVWKGIYMAPGEGTMFLDQRVDKQDRVLGLLVANGENEIDRNRFYSCLLAREAGGGLYERIGLLSMGDVSKLGKDGKAYFDVDGNFLDHFAISNTQRMHPFADTADRRTICLV